MLSKKTLVNRCMRLRPESEDLLGLGAGPDRLPPAGVKTALRDLARRWKQFDDEVKTHNNQIEALARTAALQADRATASASKSPADSLTHHRGTEQTPDSAALSASPARPSAKPPPAEPDAEIESAGGHQTWPSRPRRAGSGCGCRRRRCWFRCACS